MRNLLTTGQMIDKLKVGEIAEGNTHWEVKRMFNGQIVELNTGTTFKIDEGFLNEKWTIHPKYVSFEVAKEAYNEGKVVISHLDDIEFEKNELKDDAWHLKARRIFEGKWSIK